MWRLHNEKHNHAMHLDGRTKGVNKAIVMPLRINYPLIKGRRPRDNKCTESKRQHLILHVG